MSLGAACAVHLTVICDFSTYRRGPLSSKDRVPSLVDESGYFLSRKRIQEFLSQARLEEVEMEFRAQIESVLSAHLNPTHLDWHCLADGGREDISDITLGLAREYGSALRIHGREFAAACQRSGLPTTDHDVLDSYSLDPDEKATRYAELLRAMPAGLSEWALHPSLGNAQAQTLEPDTLQVRKADFDFFMSPEARDILNEEGIVLMDYRALQTVWWR